MEKRVALYPRVSSQEQAEKYSIGEQIERMEAYCKARGWSVYHIYTDPGYSGGDMDRPGLKQLIRDCESGKFDMVLVYKLDRLSRSQKDTMFLIEDVFLKNGIDFTSVNENLDTSTPTGRAFIGLLSVFAQLERDQIKERMKMGKTGRAKQGKFHGSKFVPLGYDYVDGDLVPNEYEAMQVKMVFDLYDEGKGARTIESIMMERGYKHRFGPWSAKTIRCVLRNKTYCGYIKHNEEWFPADHEKIVDEETQLDIISRLDALSEAHNRDKKYSSFLGGFIYCANCGAKFTAETGKKSKSAPAPRYYCCHSRTKKVKKMIKDPNCRNKNWRMGDLDGIIFNEIRKIGLDPNYITTIKNGGESPEETEKRTTLIEKRIEEINKQISNLMKFFSISGVEFEEVQAQITPLTQERKALEFELADLEAEQENHIDDEEVYQTALTLDDCLASGEIDNVRAVVSALISSIEIDQETVTINWKFA